MDRIKQIIDSNDTWAGRLFVLVSQGLIVLSLITFSIETLPDLSEPARRWLHFAEVFTFFVLTVGLGVVAVPAGLVASALSKAREMEDQEKER